MYDLLPDDHEMLRSHIDLFDFESNDGQEIGDILVTHMSKYRGVGLAANQIGLSVRAFAIMTKEGPKVLFNPVLTELSPDTIRMEEGCLSFPGIVLKIARPMTCRVVYNRPDGARDTMVLGGREARIALHEIDHLNGITFMEKAPRLSVKLAMEKARKLANRMRRTQ